MSESVEQNTNQIINYMHHVGNNPACWETKQINTKEQCGWNLCSIQTSIDGSWYLIFSFWFFFFFKFDFIAQKVQGVSTLFTFSLSAHYWFTEQCA